MTLLGEKNLAGCIRIKKSNRRNKQLIKNYFNFENVIKLVISKPKVELNHLAIII